MFHAIIVLGKHYGTIAAVLAPEAGDTFCPLKHVYEAHSARLLDSKRAIEAEYTHCRQCRVWNCWRIMACDDK